MNVIQKIALAILIIGGLNWGLVGFFNFKLVGLHRTYIGQIERADKNVSIKTIEQICNAINMDVKDFFDFSNLK